jgi:hypothetical protein
MSMNRMDTPYVGLVPYQERDADRFCGRAQETEELVSLTLSSRCLVIHGPSGVGKSSLLRAGVIHTLHGIAAAQTAAFGKPDFVVGCCANWKEDNPLRSVSAAISAAWGREVPRARLRDLVATCVREEETDLVLIFDQFEEFFLYHPAAVNQPGGAAHGFLAQVAELMGKATGAGDRVSQLPVHLVITLREEALAKLDGLRTLLPGLLDQVYRVEPLSIEQAISAVVEPIEWWNQAHPQEPAVAVTREFAEQVVAQVRLGQVTFAELSQARQSTATAAAQPDAVEAPFLQLVLERIWLESMAGWGRQPGARRELTRFTQDAAAIVNDHLKVTLEESRENGVRVFSPGELELVARLSLHLVTTDLAKIAHSAASLAQFVDSPPAAVRKVLDKLVGARILRAVAHPSDPEHDRYEIHHDMLGKAIVSWRSAYLKKFEAAKQRRKLRHAFAGLLVMLVVILALGYLYKQTSDLKDEVVNQRNAAQARAEEIKRLSEELAQQTKELISERANRKKEVLESVQSAMPEASPKLADEIRKIDEESDKQEQKILQRVNQKLENLRKH